jgi:hypothetical protein
MKASNPKGGLLIAAMVGLAVLQPSSGMAQSVTVQGVVDGLLGGILGGWRTNPPQPIMAEEARRQMVNVLSGRPYNVPRADAEAFVAQLTEALTRDNAPRSFTSPSGVRMSIFTGPSFTRTEGLCRAVRAGMKRSERGPDEVRVDATFCWTGQHWGTLVGDITGALAAPRQQPQPQQPGRQAAQQPAQQPSPPPPSRRDIAVSEELDETRTVRTSTVMRAEPTTQSASVRQLTAGQTIQLTGNLRGSPWVRIEANGMRGWVLLSTLSEPENIPARPTTTAPPSSPNPPAQAPQQAAPTGNIWQRMQEANPLPPSPAAPATAPTTNVPLTPTAPARTQETPRPAPQAPAPQAAQPQAPTPIPATPPAAVVQPAPQPPQEAAPPAQTAPAPQPPPRPQRRLDASM